MDNEQSNKQNNHQSNQEDKQLKSFSDIGKELNISSKQVEHSFNSAMHKIKKQCFEQNLSLEDFWLESIARSKRGEYYE